MPELLELPNELLPMVCDRLSERATCSLMSTCHTLYSILQSYAYRRNIMKSRSTLLPYVIAAGNPQSIELVLNIKCRPKLKYLALNREGNTALLAAISTGNVSAALKLISRGGKQLNRENRSTKWLPLSLAVSQGQNEIVQALIARKVRPGNNPEDSWRHHSPLLIAAKDCRHDLVATLLTMSTLDRRVSDHGLQTALDLAVISGCLLTVKSLLEDPMENPQELYGSNPIFHAIESENVEMVEALVQGGIRVTRSHLSKALRSGNQGLVAALDGRGRFSVSSQGTAFRRG